MTMVGPQRHAMDLPASNNMPISTRLFADSVNSPLRSFKNEDNSLDMGYYLHKKSLGEGGFGKVRLATHLKTNQKVAIKMMNKEKLGDDIHRVRIEIDALKILQHDNIAKLLQVIESSTEIYLVLEYCSGGELFDYLIAKKRLTESEVRCIIKDLFRVLLYIHNRGFAHRDLKPENILFDGNHKIKLIDFGLAADSSQNKSALSFLSTCCGSPAYAAPELLRGLTYSGPAVDVWSAGVLLYSLLVGQLPFDDENINNLYKKIQIGRFVMPQWLSSDVRDLISSMLKTNPSERISVTKVLEHRWTKRDDFNLKPSSLNNSPPKEFDDEAFKCCRILFPDLSEAQLHAKIRNFGYHTSTYLLLKNNAEAKKFVNESHPNKSLAQQHQHLMSAYSPRVNAVKRKLALDGEAGNNVTPVKRTKDVPPVHIPTPFSNSARPENKVQPQVATPKFPVPNERQKLLLAIRNPNAPRTTQSPRLTEKTARKILSPKMRTNGNNENNVVAATTKADNTPLTSKLANIKSPLKQIDNRVAASPVPIPKTPVSVAKKPLKNSTSKKSLLKRIMASATPAKSHAPRILNSSNQSNNITMTTFQEPQECIDRLVHTLAAKGVECKQKEYGPSKSTKSKPPRLARWSKFTFVVRKNPTKFDTI